MIILDKFTIGGIVANVGLVGVTLMAFLSGYTAVNSPYANLAVFTRSVTEVDIKKAEEQLASSVQHLFQLKKEGYTKSSRQNSFFSSGSNIDAQIRQQEIFVQQLYKDLDSLNMDFDRHLEMKSWYGVYKNLLGYVFSLYCVYKVIMTFFNILLSTEVGSDPVTKTLDIVVDWLGIDLDVEAWSQFLSLVFIGVMVVMAVRGFLIHVSIGY